MYCVRAGPPLLFYIPVRFIRGLEAIMREIRARPKGLIFIQKIRTKERSEVYENGFRERMKLIN